MNVADIEHLHGKAVEVFLLDGSVYRGRFTSYENESAVDDGEPENIQIDVGEHGCELSLDMPEVVSVRLALEGSADADN